MSFYWKATDAMHK